MGDIDVGAGCTDHSYYAYGGYTVIDLTNPANGTGTIDYVCIWWGEDPTTAVVASSDAEGANVFSTPAGGSAALADRGTGQQEYNAPGDFTAFNINVDGYLTTYSDADISVWTDGGSGMHRRTPNFIPMSSVDMVTPLADYRMGAYATGTEAGDGPTMPIFDYYYNQSRL